jgi:hypothetical protein
MVYLSRVTYYTFSQHVIPTQTWHRARLTEYLMIRIQNRDRLLKYFMHPARSTQEVHWLIGQEIQSDLKEWSQHVWHLHYSDHLHQATKRVSVIHGYVFQDLYHILLHNRIDKVDFLKVNILNPKIGHDKTSLDCTRYVSRNLVPNRSHLTPKTPLHSASRIMKNNMLSNELVKLCL